MRVYSIFHRPAKLLAAGSLLFAALLAGQTAFAQSIINSKHDLSSTSTSNLGIKSVSGATGTAEVCVFCHTPHGANSAAPLWNRAASTGTYTFYNKATSYSMDSPDAGNASIGLQSTMCLSCHDGTSALNLLINNPGSGVGTAPVMTINNMSSLYGSLSIDLANDHPVGVEYCGGANVLLTAVPAGCVDKDFKLTSLIKNSGVAVTAFAAGLAGDKWWLDMGTVNGTREKTDMPLYVATGNLVPTVQCATCHDAHNNNGAGTVASFLRTSNAASIMCTTCHNK